MIEMPEAFTISQQMNDTLVGKEIEYFEPGNLTHKFLWLNRPIEEYQSNLPGKVIEKASSYGRSIYLHLGNHKLWWSDAGGKILYQAAGEKLPKKYHLRLQFCDDTSLTYTLQMWGAVKLLECDAFDEIPYEETGIPPLHPDFTIERLNQMLDEYPEKNSKGIKGFLVATGYVMPNHINGLGNAIIQDILFRAHLDPKKKTDQILPEERIILFNAIQKTIQEAIELGGRYDEFDLYGNKGRYIRLMDKNTVGTPCVNCGEDIKKISYLGGACYICPNCQE